jgi:hypothetical protein
MPGKVNRSQISSQDTQVTGAAVWQNEAASQALKDFLRTQQMRIGDIKSGTGISERNKKNVAADQKELLKKALPIDPQPCGYAIVGAAPVPVFLYPHHHSLADFMHAHDSIGPNINIAPDSQTMRQSVASSKTLPAPAPANLSNGGVLDSILTTLANLPIVKQIIT